MGLVIGARGGGRCGGFAFFDFGLKEFEVGRSEWDGSGVGANHDEVVDGGTRSPARSVALRDLQPLNAAAAVGWGSNYRGNSVKMHRI